MMLTIFFDHEGIVHQQYVPNGQTVNKEYYVEVLHQLRDVLRCRRPALWKQGDWQLHHNNAPTHSSHLVQHFLAKHQIPHVPQPPCLPDMAPCDFVKMLNGIMFQDTEKIKRNAATQLLAVLKSQFQKCFGQWKGHWKKCVVSEGATLKEIRTAKPYVCFLQPVVG